MEILERGPILLELSRLLHEASGGNGRLVFVGGEPGIGKTVLVRRFSDLVATSARVLLGACDPLTTPRPLAPLHDVAQQIGTSRLADTLASSELRPRIFQATLQELSSGAVPNVVTFEDVHWADEATLDLLRYLGRRIEQTRTLLLATYRDDEVGDRHPLRLVLGDLATTPGVRRLSVAPISLDAVRTLARGSGLEPAELHRQTGGNPFYVTAILAAGGERIPATVRDAVLARAARLPEPAAAVLEAAAVIGYRVEPWLLQQVAEPAADALQACVAAGMLHDQDAYVVFPHELTREAVLSAVSPQRRTILNQRALAALRAAPGGRNEVARLAHHAEFAGDGAAVLEYAPEAARRAEKLGAHREAAAQYARALRFADNIPVADRSALLVKYSFENATIDNYDDAIRADHEIIRLWRNGPDPLLEGWSLTYLAACLIAVGRMNEADAYSQESIAILEAQPPSRELAEAYAYRANLLLNQRQCAAAIEVASRARDIASAGGHRLSALNATVRLGAARMASGDDGGRELLEQCLPEAASLGAHLFGATAYAQLGAIAAEQHDFLRADAYLTAGLTYAAEHETDAPGNLMRATHAQVQLQLGQWESAEENTRHVLRRTGATANSHIIAHTALGKLCVRRGAPEAAAELDRALELALPTGMLLRLAPVYAARAELAWLNGDLEQCRREATAVLPQALDDRHAWFAGELLGWLARAGESVAAPDWVPPPYAHMLAQAWHDAAHDWQARGCSYDAACALLETGDETAQRQALETFEQLNAAPMLQQSARRLREAGVRSVPRGPRASTRNNPALLTRRELQILELMAEGLHNPQIAQRLFLSPKTVGHHVSAILTKLEVPTRTAAARLAEQLGLLQQK